MADHPTNPLIDELTKNTKQKLSLKSNGWTKLHEAAEAGNIELVKSIIAEKQCNIDAREDGSEVSPLWVAAEKGHTEVVEYLVDQGADVHAKSIDGATPLWMAVHDNNIKIVECLIQHGADADVEACYSGGIIPETALFVAALKGYVDMTRLLVESGKADVNLELEDGSTPIWIASHEGHVKVVQYLLENKANPNHADKSGVRPITAACEKEQEAVISMLLQNGARPSQREFVSVSNSGMHSVLALMLKVNPAILVDDVKAVGMSALFVACQSGHYETARVLLEDCKASVDVVKSTGATPLIIASQLGFLDVVQLLVEHGANVNHKQNAGVTAACFAADYGRLPVLTYLHKHGANVLQPGARGATPIFLAAYKGHLEVVEWLLSAGATPYSAEEGGISALAIACNQSHMNVVQVMIAFIKLHPELPQDLGCTLELNKKGVSPLALAYSDKVLNKDIIALLLSSGASKDGLAIQE